MLGSRGHFLKRRHWPLSSLSHEQRIQCCLHPCLFCTTESPWIYDGQVCGVPNPLGKCRCQQIASFNLGHTSQMSYLPRHARRGVRVAAPVGLFSIEWGVETQEQRKKKKKRISPSWLLWPCATYQCSGCAPAMWYSNKLKEMALSTFFWPREAVQQLPGRDQMAREKNICLAPAFAKPPATMPLCPVVPREAIPAPAPSLWNTRTV